MATFDPNKTYKIAFPTEWGEQPAKRGPVDFDKQTKKAPK